MNLLCEMPRAIRRGAFAVLLAAVACAQPLRLVPEPRRVELREGRLWLNRPLDATAVPPSAAIDHALQHLRRDMPVGGRGGPRLLIGLLGRPAIETEIGERGLDPELARRPEGYLLDVRPQGILIAAASEAGLFYGAQTLRQVVRKEGAAFWTPFVTIADAPALPYRGLSVDISRGPVLTEAAMRALVDTLAEFKMNMLSFYMEHVFPYEHAPLAAPPGTGLTPERFRRLADYARTNHIVLVPQQQMFGHLHQLLKHESYAAMGERPHGHVLAPGDEGAEQWIAAAGRQLAEIFPGPWIHVGGDETFELGRGRSSERVERDGFARTYAAHLQRVVKLLAPLGRRILFWGDMALAHPELLEILPRELVAVSWHYEPRGEYASLLVPFRRSGFAFFVAPGVSNWMQIFPRLDLALPNINGFTAEGKRQGAVGMLNTHWNDQGEGLFGLAWYPVLFGAAAAWEPGEVAPARFARAYDWAFHRAEDERAARIIERLARAQRLLVEAGIDVPSNRLFWMDPFSAWGAEIIEKGRATAGQVRRLVEENLLELRDFAPPRRREQARLLELASRRLNYAAMKIQFAGYMAEAYHRAWENRTNPVEVRRSLRRLTSTDGYIEDLRAEILGIRALFRRAWLEENEPYWLDNVMVMYDAEALYWQNRARQFAGIYQDYQVTGDLPAPETIGFRRPKP